MIITNRHSSFFSLYEILNENCGISPFLSNVLHTHLKDWLIKIAITLLSI